MRIRTIAIAGLAVAAVAYLFDPIAGSSRRSRLRERIAALRQRRTMPERMPPLPVNMIPAPTSETATMSEEPSKQNVPDMPRERSGDDVADASGDRSIDDAVIAGRIRLKVLGRPDLETGNLVVDVVRGVAFLRGDLTDSRQLEEVVNLTNAVPGVQQVQNFIHLPESPTTSTPAAPLGDAWSG